MTIALWILAVDLTTVAIAWAMCRCAPFGYQDRDGFHAGVPPLGEG